MRLIIGALVMAGMSLGASAQEASSEPQRHNWIELGLGSVSGVAIKTAKANRGWALSIAAYDVEQELDFSSRTDRRSQKSIDRGISEIALMRTYSKHGRWFYSDLAIGVGYMDATLANNCEKTGNGWLGYSYLCDEERTKGLSLPMELDIAVGRYAGIGLKLRATIGPESTAGAALIIPLGGFAKH